MKKQLIALASTVVLALTVVATTGGASPASDASASTAADCLDEVANSVTVLPAGLRTNPSTGQPTILNVNANAFGAYDTVDARAARVEVPFDPDDSSVGDQWPVIVRVPDRCIVGGDVRIDLADSTATPWNGPGGWKTTAGVTTKGNPSATGATFVGMNMRNVGDGFTIGGGQHLDPNDPDQKATIVGNHVARSHDDCVEDDGLVNARIADNLFDGCFVFLSTRRPNQALGPGVDQTVEITNNLIHLEPMPSWEGTDDFSSTTRGHGQVFKMDDAPPYEDPEIHIDDNLFLVDGPIVEGASNSFPGVVPTEDPNDPETAMRATFTCDTPESNTVIWAGDPQSIPNVISQMGTHACFDVVLACVPAAPPAAPDCSWREQWDAARAAWVDEHARGGAYVALPNPVRVLDVSGAGALGAGETRRIDLRDHAGLPTNAEVAAFVVNVTAVPSHQTSFTLWGEGPQPPPQFVAMKGYHNANYRRDSLVVVPGRDDVTAADIDALSEPLDSSVLRIHNESGALDVAVDVVGYVTWSPGTADVGGSLGSFSVLPPARLVDDAPVGTTEVAVAVAGVGAVPASAAGVALNLTARNGTTATDLHVSGGAAATQAALGVWPAPHLSQSLVFVPLDANGEIHLSTGSGAADVTADVVGYFDGSSTGDGWIVPTTPTRIEDSTAAGPLLGKWWPNTTRHLEVDTAGDVPAGAEAVVLLVNALETSADSGLTIWPKGATEPSVPALEWKEYGGMSNLVIAQIGEDGEISIRNANGRTHVIVDVVGFVGGGFLSG